MVVPSSSLEVRMRRIGLIGGLAWPSTEVYHRRINEEVNRRLGDNHSARLVVWAEDFELIAMLQREGRWDEAGDILAGGARAVGPLAPTCSRSAPTPCT
jgi:aspartate racemase